MGCGELSGSLKQRGLEFTSLFNRLLWLPCRGDYGSKDGIRETCVEVVAFTAGNNEGFSQRNRNKSVMKWLDSRDIF